MIEYGCILDKAPHQGGGTERVSPKRSAYQGDPDKGGSVQCLIELSNLRKRTFKSQSVTASKIPSIKL